MQFSEEINNVRKYLGLQIANYSEQGIPQFVAVLKNLKGLLDGSKKLSEKTEQKGLSTITTYSVVDRDPSKPTPRG